MWNIVKCELSYVKWLILIGAAIFILDASAYLSLMLTGNLFSASFTVLFCDDSFGEICAIMAYLLLYVFLFVNLILEYLEIRERRLMQYALLPISKWKLATARVLIPLTVLLISAVPIIFYLILKVLFFLAPYISNLRAGSEQLLIELRCLIVSHYYHWNYFVQDYINLFALVMLISYTARLWTESYGRVVLGILALISLFDGLVLPFINPQLAWKTGDYVDKFINRYYFWHYPYILCIALFIVVIFISFMRRRSYLQ